ncbi:MAG: hypothetical protein ABJB66_13870 [Gemmatimonadaceae bacterium]
MARSSGRIALFVILVFGVTLVSSLKLHAQQSAAGRMEVRVKPDTLRVGDPFTMTVSMDVPAGAHVTWPTPADSNGPFGLRAPVHVTGSEGGATRKETAEYSMVAWSVGKLTVALPDIKVSTNGTETVVPFQAPSLFVESVLPADTSLRVPKPAKGLFPRVIPWWEMWWPVLLVLLLLAIVFWLVSRRKRRRVLMIELDPFARAERDFQRLDRLALGEAGEQGRFVALAVEVLRTYLSVRISEATLALTSDELLVVVTPDSRVPTQRLSPLLAEADAIKFGQHPVAAPHARELALEARAIVSGVEQADEVRRAEARAQQKTEKKDEQKRERQQRKIEEERARKASRRGKEAA